MKFKNKTLVKKIIKHITSFLVLLSAGYIGRGLIIIMILLFTNANIQIVNYIDIFIGMLLFLPLLYLRTQIDNA